jgi:hypothetical protein
VNTWLEITPGAAAGALVTPKLPIRSTAAKNDFAIFIQNHLLSFYVHTQWFRQRPCHNRENIRKPLSGENQESYRWLYFSLERIVPKKSAGLLARAGIWAMCVLQ